MRLRLVPGLAAVLLVLSACGTPKAGDDCETTGFLCESQASALECRVGTWVSLACKGGGGCSRDGDTVKCDMTGNVEGDKCASSAEGKGLCTSDGLGTLECRQGTLLKTNDCRSCSVEGDSVICTPP